MKDFLSRLIGGHRRDKPATPAHLTLSTPTAVEGYVAAALLHHGAGRLAEAEPLYRRALALDAENFDALHMLGVAQLQAGHGATAVELIERAIALAPENGVAHSNLGLATNHKGGWTPQSSHCARLSRCSRIGTPRKSIWELYFGLLAGSTLPKRAS